MQTFSVKLLDNAAATGDAVQWPGGRGVFSVSATDFDGNTISLQAILPDGATYLNTGTNTTLTANGFGGFDLPPCKIKAAVTGAGTTVAANATVARVPA